MIDETELSDRVRKLIEDCEGNADYRSQERARVERYYRGEVPEMPAEEGKSSVVSKDFRAAVRKLMPAIMRTFFGSDEVGEFLPVGENDDGKAKQATLYFNKVVVPESGAEDAVHDAIMDALKHDHGVLKWYWDERKSVCIETRTGLVEEQLQQLQASDGVEILETWNWQSIIEATGEEITVYGVRIKREVIERKAVMVAVPLDEFGMHPDAKNIETAPIVYHKNRVSKSDLLARGYDAERVESLPIADPDVTGDNERGARDDDGDYLTRGQRLDDELAEVEIYECYLRIDMDGDGIAELRRIDFVASNVNEILFNDYAAQVQMAILVPERQPHSATGHSLFDDVEDIQRVKTALTRQTLDNLYWQNMPQPIVQEGVIVNPDSVLSPEFGKAIRVRQGTDARAAFAFNQVPFFAKESYSMMDRWDQALIDRTGISPSAAGLDPNSLQDVREQGVAMISDAAAAQAWCVVRALSRGIKKAFRGLMKVVIENQDHARMIMVDGNPMQFDPRSWSMDMDFEPNVGLGTGTRERDLSVLMMIAGYQEKIVANMGLMNPFVKPEHMHNTLSQIVKVSGLRTPTMFFAEPKPEELAALAQPKPSPEEMKLNMQMQLEDKKMAAQRDKEVAQAEADLIVKRAEMEKEAAKAGAQLELEREKIASQERIAFAKLKQERELELMKMGAIDTPEGPIGETSMNAQAITAAISQLGMMIEAMRSAMSAPRRLIFDPATGDPVGSEIMNEGMVQ